MKESYAANQLLRDLGQNAGFKVFIFDDPDLFGPEIKLREKSKDAEIDAVLLYKNIICIVGINAGSGESVNSEITKFFEKLDKIEDVRNLDLNVKVTAKSDKKIQDKRKSAETSLEEVNKYIEDVSAEYKLILRKIFFCPFRRLEEETIRKTQKEEKVIDKDIFDYFQAVLNRLNKGFLFYDLAHFLEIRIIDIEKKSASKMPKPEKTAPFQVSRLPLEKDKIIMYSLPLAAENIMEYATVLRVARKYDKKGFQRMVKPGRLKKINEDYLKINETFPNNVIIALDPELYVNEKDFYDPTKRELTFFKEYNSLIIIDGQHRFFSLVVGGKKSRNILVTLIFFNNEDEEKNYLSMYRMFYKINKTQERIDPNLSFVLKAKIDTASEENFWNCVFENLDKKGFFAKRFSFKETTMRKKSEPRSIVSVITYGGVLTLNRTYKKKGIEVPGLDIFYGSDRTKNVEFAFNLLKNYFDIVEAVLYDQGVSKDLLTPREIGALIRLIKHFIIDNQNGLKELGSVENITKKKTRPDKNVVKYFTKTLHYIPFSDTLSLEYPASNWAAVEGYMLKKINFKKTGFGNRSMLSKKGLEVYKITKR